jgi:uncharacterized protein YggE
MRNDVAIVFAGVLLSLCVSSAAADALPRQVSVTGTATLTAAPDRASVSLGIQARNLSLDAARDRVAKVAGNFLGLCRQLGIPENKVQTTALTMRPEYRWDPNGREQEFAGYFVQRSLTVELQDLELLGQLIEGAVDTGVNEVSPPRLDSSQRQRLHREALAKAAEDARANAETLATALGAKLGPVRLINAENIGRPPQPMPMRAQMAESADAAATYQPGDIRFDAQVNATFDLQ